MNESSTLQRILLFGSLLLVAAAPAEAASVTLDTPRAGSVDPSFTPPPIDGASFGVIYSVVLQPDGKVVIGGNFTTVDGVVRGGIARLNPDGSLDRSFQEGMSGAGSVRAVLLQPDGKVVIGGFFSTVNGVSHNYIARLNVDGSLDSSFQDGTGVLNGVGSLALQPDGKVLVAGNIFGQVTRLNPDGSRDLSFQTAGFHRQNIHYLYSIALQPDGRVVIGGRFSDVGNRGPTSRSST